MSYVRFGLSALLMLSALLILAISVFGVYRFRFVLDRMQAAAMTDTLALMLAMASLLVAMGFRLATVKLIAIVVFMWCASPISSHLLCLLEVRTDDELEQHVRLDDRTNREEE